MDKQWKMVPVEPTDAMISEGACASSLPGPHYISESAAVQCWRNMLAAAPQPPSASDERGLLAELDWCLENASISARVHSVLTASRSALLAHLKVRP